MKFLILLFIGSLAFAQTDLLPTISAKSIYMTGQDPDGHVRAVPITGIVSSNSTSATLGAGQTWAPDYFDVEAYAGISVLLKTPQASAVDGAKVIFSTDCVNPHRTLATTIPASSTDGFFFSIPIEAKCVKLSYTNGSVSQTAFSIQTIANMVTVGPVLTPIVGTINDLTSVTINKSILTAKKENGTYDNVGASNSGGLKVAITDRPSEVRNRTRVEKRIFREALTTSATATVIHTVTPGKTFYLSSFVMSALNNANAIGEWRIRDGTTDKLGFVAGEKAVGAAAPSTAQSPALPEPIPFTTSVNAYEVSGDMQVSLYLIGYEEAN